MEFGKAGKRSFRLFPGGRAREGALPSSKVRTYVLLHVLCHGAYFGFTDDSYPTYTGPRFVSRARIDAPHSHLEGKAAGISTFDDARDAFRPLALLAKSLAGTFGRRRYTVLHVWQGVAPSRCDESLLRCRPEAGVCARACSACRLASAARTRCHKHK
ncbi:hypothetical protein PENSPDRAFT_510214 [Peniophora sp. CONT]|nr:hypothetical protein PENSPDRAFT_510214 [Peniophora sp. CONT]